MNKSLFLYVVAAMLLIMSSCNKDENNNDTNPTYNPTPYTLNIPSNLPAMNIPADNPLTVEGIELGRLLYYDSLLDQNQARACGGCHLQANGFTTLGTNVIPHINLGYQNKFLWNGSVQGTLEDAMFFEVKDFFKADLSKLQADSKYPDKFYKAFGSSTVTYENCAKAMAQFLRTMVSGNSKFDRYVRHEENFTADETEGFMIFYTEKGDCFHCHTVSIMTDGQLHNNGLDSVFIGVNAGYYNVSGNPADLGKFKSPSLRNCGMRTTFMHDSRYTSLEDVIEFYNSGTKHSPSLDPIMTKPGKEYGLQLTPYDKQCLKAFLLTLTDTTYINNPAFSNPF